LLGLNFISLCDGERLGAVVFAVVRSQGEVRQVRRQARRCLPPLEREIRDAGQLEGASSFMIRSIALAIALLACSQASAAVFVTVEDWFNAPPEQQVSYVAGTLDTLLSSSTGALAKGTLEHFIHCVSDSHLTPGQLADDIRKHPPKGLVSMQAVVLVSLTQRCGPPNPQ
jgi:hypothetical protein